MLLYVYTFRGFCYFNSVAIAAKLLQQRLNVSKILIVDWVSFMQRGCILFSLLYYLFITYVFKLNKHLKRSIWLSRSVCFSL